MKYLVLCLVLLVSCGPRPNPSPPESDVLTESTRNQLLDRASLERTWAYACNGVATQENCGDLGDSTLWNGLLCLSGELLFCPAAQDAQGPDGRWWRSPQQANIENPDSFSRDMYLGVLAYLIKTKDADAATRWMNWIQSNGNRTCKVASDNRCDITAGLWGFTGLVWKYLGLTPTQKMKDSLLGSQFTLLVESSTGSIGYPMNLDAIVVLLYQSINMNSVQVQKAANTLYSRQNQNAFFAYVSKGSAESIANLVLSECPWAKPIGTQNWSWEQNQANSPWIHSEAWDCIFLINLVTK